MLRCTREHQVGRTEATGQGTHNWSAWRVLQRGSEVGEGGGRGWEKKGEERGSGEKREREEGDGEGRKKEREGRAH